MIKIKFEGGLGNQTYQLCLALFLRKKGFKVVLDASYYINENTFHEGLSIEKLFDLSSFEVIRAKKTELDVIQLIKSLIPIVIKSRIRRYLNLKRVEYNLTQDKSYQFWDETMFGQLGTSVKDFNFKNNVDYSLRGYWQDEEIVDLVINDLKLLLIDYSNQLIDDNVTSQINYNNSVLIHFRGGDFLSPKHKENFDILTEEYYEKSMKYFLDFLKNPIFYLYFDDDYQMNRLLPKGEYNTVVLGKLSDNAVFDFHIQMKHEYFICSNSTFSWWTAKLSGARKVALYPDEMINNNKINSKVKDFKEMK